MIHLGVLRASKSGVDLIFICQLMRAPPRVQGFNGSHQHRMIFLHGCPASILPFLFPLTEQALCVIVAVDGFDCANHVRRWKIVEVPCLSGSSVRVLIPDSDVNEGAMIPNDLSRPPLPSLEMDTRRGSRHDKDRFPDHRSLRNQSPDSDVERTLVVTFI